MLGSAVIEVAIGLGFFYLLLSLISSTLSELISSLFALRSNTLAEGIRSLLNDPPGAGLSKAFYDHPLIKSLMRPTTNAQPSYIPSRTFALVLLDMVAPADPQAAQKPFAHIREAVTKLPDDQLKRALLPLLDDAEGDLRKVRQNLQRWFDDAMERVSGWYKRKAQAIIFLLALAVSLALNADTLTIASGLWRDPALRAAVTAAAEEVTKQPLPAGADPSVRMQQLQKQIEQLRFPIGWSAMPGEPSRVPDSPEKWLMKILGLLFTTAAASLGADFWFGIVSKLINLRGAGKPPTQASAPTAEEGGS